MMFRILLFVSVLLAPMEGAPNNTRPCDPRAEIPADHFSIFIILSAVFIFIGFLFGVICTIIFRHLKKNFWREVTRQDSLEADIKSRAAPNGEQEDEITIVNDDAPHGPMAEPRDVHKDTNISSPGPHYVLTNIDSYKDMIISSAKEQEDEITIVNDDAPHGPMAEPRDVHKDTNISSPGPLYVLTSIEPYKDMIISSAKEQEDEITIVHDDAPHGPMAEPRDVHKDTNISTPGPHYVLTNIDPYKDMIISSAKEQEDEITIVNDDAPHGPMAEQRDVHKDTNISTPGPHYVLTNIDPYKDMIISSDEEQEDEILNVNDDALHGPMAEKGDVLKNISTPGPDYVIINIDPYVDVISSSNEEQEDKITNINDDAPRGSVAENRDVFENIIVSKPKPDYVIINMDLDEEVVTHSDNEEERGLAVFP